MPNIGSASGFDFLLSPLANPFLFKKIFPELSGYHRTGIESESAAPGAFSLGLGALDPGTWAAVFDLALRLVARANQRFFGHFMVYANQ